MTSHLPSSFASAAAGQNANRDTRGGRNDGRGAGGGDQWSRRDGRSANGTLTFRRSSTTPLSQTNPPPSTDHHAVHPPPAEAPIAQQPTIYEVGPSRYSRDDLLEMFDAQKPREEVSRLFIPGWDPSAANGSSARERGWGKTSDNLVPQDPGSCWINNRETRPIGLDGFSPEDSEAFSSDINSPLKPPQQQQQQNKEAHQGAVNGRKLSVSQSHAAASASANAFAANSPSSATRPSTRRRETIESNPFSAAASLASPTTSASASRFARDEQSFWFPRKTGDLKESDPDDADHDTRDAPKLPIGSLLRSNTSGAGTGSGSGGLASMWPPSTSTSSGVGVGGASGGFGNFALPTTPAIGDKRVGASGGSRLAHLIPKDTSSDSATARGGEGSWRPRPRTDTDPFGAGDEELPVSGSAVLGGAQDTGPAASHLASRVGTLGTPVKGSAGDFGMSGLTLCGGGGGSGDEVGPVSPSETNPYRSPPAERHEQSQDAAAAAPSDAQQLEGRAPGSHESHPNLGTISRGFSGAFDGSDRSQTSSAGAKGYPLGGLSGWPAPVGSSTATPDRERPNYGSAFGSSLFNPMGDLQSPGLSNLNNVFGPSNTGSIGRGSKLGSLFPPTMQAQMQQQQQQQQQQQSLEHENGLSDALGDLRQSNPLGAIGRGAFGMPARESDSPMRSSRGMFEELFPSSDSSRAHAVFGATDVGQSSIAAAAPQSFTPGSGGLPFGGPQPGMEPPSAQVRQMVMPDRMRWVYLDPQGQIQGPFTGLEMNDWYKANFFTPDLRVKKLEDPEFEPLGQLIRRIGNSREPFLVPQIGIAHGPPIQSGHFGPSNGNGIIPPLSGVFPTFGRTLTAEEQNNLERRKQEEQFLMAQQRDFMMRQQAMAKYQMQGPNLQHHSSAHSLQSQPSFGSMTSPIGMPQQQQQPPPQQPLQQQQQLQHQLPPQQQQQQPIGPMAPVGGFDAHSGLNSGPRAGAGLGGNGGELFRQDELASLTAAERQMLASMQGVQGPGGDPASVHQGMGGVAGEESLRFGLPGADELAEDPEGFKDRLREFEGLRASHEAQQKATETTAGEVPAKPQEAPVPEEAVVAAAAPQPVEAPPPTSSQAAKHTKASKKKAAAPSEDAALSLTQQVQKTQASSTASVGQDMEPGMPLPFPPPASTTPLPAPLAQRAKSNLPEQFNRSQSGTPDATQPPPLAPWAKEPGQEGQKGPSLKEIQEAEARKAAKAEEAAAALRKAAMEQEVAQIREKEKSAAAAAAAVAAAGLPATSTWGQSSPVSTATPWTKPGGASKAKGVSSAGTVGAAGSKKTLAEIQREEEARKQKAKDMAVQSGVPVSNSKSYANLASKQGQVAAQLQAASPIGASGPGPASISASASAGSGWATVGAGGKVKTPTGPAAQAQTQPRAVSSTNSNLGRPPPTGPAKMMSKPVVSMPSARIETSNAAMDEFSKWAHRELSRGITGVNDISSFQADLAVLPLDTGIIADAVYAHSTTMDGRHFAEEYVRRKKLAEKGVVEKQTAGGDSKASSSAGSGGGWSEVAKKSSSGNGNGNGGAGVQQQSEGASSSMQGAGFKVIPSRKKGKK